MEPKAIRPKKGPEEEIVQRLIPFWRCREWHVMRTHGNMYQSGFPDFYITHHIHGPRWVEAKNLMKFSFTPAQLEHFPKMLSHGSRIWIITDSTEDEYNKLFGPCNAQEFLYQHMFRRSRK